MRLAGYDWVPDAKLTRSLRESWQRGRAGRSQNTCWSLQVHLQRNNRVPDRPAGTKGGFVGLSSVTAYMRYFPEKLATGVATAFSTD